MNPKSFRCRLAPARPVGALWAILSCLVSITSVFSFVQPVWFTGKWPNNEHYVLSHTEPTSLTLGLFTFCQNLRDSTVHHCQGYNRLQELNLSPSFVWQMAVVCLGIGTTIMLLTAFAALTTLCCSDSKNNRVAKFVGHFQLFSVLMMTVGLSLLPAALGSPLVQMFCGHGAFPYHLDHCQFGWSYALSFMGTLLALFCPFLARHTSFQSFDVNSVDVILLPKSPYRRLYSAKEYYI